ncbi:MAG: hypothetical protein R3F11_07785 [Verrucomicrobiales bacterium]
MPMLLCRCQPLKTENFLPASPIGLDDRQDADAEPAALKGRDLIAQGNALGSTVSKSG